MGEYAKYHGAQVKIGTCEQMYYLRWDQARLVRAESHSVDPVREGLEGVIRFRFPFPDEDGIEPGEFKSHDRGLTVYGIEPPAALADEHYSVQFRADPGYLTSLPCPESGKVPDGVKIGRNGFRGAVQLVCQRWYAGRLVSVVRCACGVMWRLETLEDARPMIDELIARADREDRETDQWLASPRGREWQAENPGAKMDSGGGFYREVAKRVEAGYRTCPDCDQPTVTTHADESRTCGRCFMDQAKRSGAVA